MTPQATGRESYDRSSISESIDLPSEQTAAAPEPAVLRSPNSSSDDTQAGLEETKGDPFYNASAIEEGYGHAAPSTNRQTHQTHPAPGEEELTRKFTLRSFLPRRSSIGSRTSQKSNETKASEKTKNVDLTLDDRLDAIKEEDEPAEEESILNVQEAQNEYGLGEEKAEDRRRRRHAIKDYTQSSSSVAKLRKYYRKVVNSSLATRSFVYWLPVALLVFIPLAADAFGSKKLYLGHSRVMWLFIWIEVVWGSFFVSRIFAHYIPELFGFVISVIAPRFFKYVDATVAMEWPNAFVIWTFISFITFYPIISDNHKATSEARGVQQWHRKLNEVLAAFLVSSLVYWCEQIFIYTLSTSYHRTRMALRIQRDKAARNILVILFEIALSFFPLASPEFAQEDKMLLSSSLAVKEDLREKYGQRFKKSKVVQNINKAVDDTTMAFGKLRRDLLDDEGPANARIVEDALSRGITTRVLAERIWKSLVLESSDVLEIRDLEELLGPDRKTEAYRMFDLIDPHDKRKLTLKNMQDAFTEIHKEHKSIAKSLVDIDSVISKLNRLLIAVCLLIVIIIFVGMLAPSVGAVLATLGSSLLALSFIFSATCQEILASCVYLFIKHPCDIGDVVMISVPNVGLQRMSVKEISLLYTVFQDGSTNVIRQVSNSILNTLFVDNISRSPPQCFNIHMVLGLPETTFDDVERLKALIDEFLEENARDYLPNPWYQVTNLPDLDRINLDFQITPRVNMEDSTMWGNRRTRFLRFLNNCVHQLHLSIPRRDDQHTSPDAPFFTVAMDPKDPVVTGLRSERYMARELNVLSKPEYINDLKRTTTSASHAVSVSSSASAGGRRREGQARRVSTNERSV
ncbi:putative MscS family protein C2C4.17c [Wickerhamiella sorbophila]|uniref:Putative MscS family protein C2C4.17c n=1 Tax=Wickerhamiella sorbophila TaxID=45607 RepID=A0A2T0FCG8_9ASCO|nr:putative MscS family protein C2C4.17c [Wickerhamiella sorbophila]PRT52698.1 putative MscS family protein C2C4.17c [Wickerhamiella sorbophila]